ncbi:MAG: site-2 protease family protein [Tepidisphaeraceae bacterium]
MLLTVRNRATDKLISNFSVQEFSDLVRAAGAAGQKLDLTVLRDGQTVSVPDVDPSARIDRGQRGLGVVLGHDDEHAVVGQVLPNTPADKASIPVGAELTQVLDTPVSSWHDVWAVLTKQAQADKPVSVKAKRPDGSEFAGNLTLSDSELQTLRSYRYVMPELALDTATLIRKTGSPFTAMAWGVGETRDLILKSYVTLKRMTVDRTVSPTNLMGPLQMLQSGALFAAKGTDWFIWFLAMISANLAVVNFLPIPVVDGGHFAFLVIEKLTGKKPSPAVQAISAYIGLGLLLSLFLFVTYNDLGRIFKIW